jgi:hypothetical protein
MNDCFRLKESFITDFKKEMDEHKIKEEIKKFKSNSKEYS